MKMLITLLSALFVMSSFAAVNPTAPGETSSGSVSIGVEVGPLVQLSQVQDITVTNWTGGAYNSNDAAQLEQKLCVYSNNAQNASLGGQYQITFSDTNNNFLLINQSDSSDKAKYELVFNGTTVATPGTITNQQGSPNLTCNGSSNATLNVNILGSSTGKALHSGTYTDTLFLTVTPQ